MLGPTAIPRIASPDALPESTGTPWSHQGTSSAPRLIPANCRRVAPVIQRLFHRRICQVELLLQEKPQHFFQLVPPSILPRPWHNMARSTRTNWTHGTTAPPAPSLPNTTPRRVFLCESCHRHQCPLLPEQRSSWHEPICTPCGSDDLTRVSAEFRTCNRSLAGGAELLD